MDSSVLCVDLLSEAPPTCCYHGDSPSQVSGLQRGEMFSVLNPVKVHGHNNIPMYTETVDYNPVIELCKSGLEVGKLNNLS